MTHTLTEAKWNDRDVELVDRALQIFERWSADAARRASGVSSRATSQDLSELFVDMASRLDDEQRCAFLMVGLLEFNGWPNAFDEAITSVSAGRLAELWLAYLLLRGQLRRYPFGSAIEDIIGVTRFGYVLTRALLDAPMDSTAFVTASRTFVQYSAHNDTLRRAFQNCWTSMPESKRTAIGVDQFLCFLDRMKEDPSPMNRESEYLRLLSYGIPSNLELLVRNTKYPMTPLCLYRRRWIDSYLPKLRSVVWQNLDRAFSDFALEADKLGGEREQVGCLLTYFMAGLRATTDAVREALVGPDKLTGSFIVDRYVFRTNEENRWGPDFALMMSFTAPDGSTLSRYVLFQAKLVDGPSVKVDTAQLKTLLRTSWHSSFYIAWKHNMAPECIPAADVHWLLEATKASSRTGRLAASPHIKWDRLGRYANTFADFLVDRFLCGEVGDPFGEESSLTPSELAEHLGQLFGPLPHGIISISIRTEYESDSSVHVAGEPQVIDYGYPSSEEVSRIVG